MINRGVLSRVQHFPEINPSEVSLKRYYEEGMHKAKHEGLA